MSLSIIASYSAWEVKPPAMISLSCTAQKLSSEKPQLIAQAGLITSRKISLSYSGKITVSIRCTTPLDAIKSVAMTLAPAIETWPSATTTA